MKKSFFLMLAAAAALLFASCTQSLPQRMDAFVANVEKNADTYTEEDWEQANETFEELCEEYKENKGSLTGDEVKQIRDAMSRYTSQVVKSGVRSVRDAIEEIGNELPGLFEDLGSIFRGIGEGISGGSSENGTTEPASEPANK